MFLVTCKSGFFYASHNKTRKLARRDHFGCTWDKEYVYAVKRHGKHNTTIERYDRALFPRGVMFLPCVQEAHQTLYNVHTHKVITVNTAFNELVEWEIPEQWVNRGILEGVNRINYTDFKSDRSGRNNPGGVKGNHINTICAHTNGYYTIHHNFGTRVPELVSLDKGFNVISKTALSDDKTAHAHNCAFIENGVVLSLLSSSNEAVFCDVEKGIVKRVNLNKITGLDLYLRGLAVTDKHIYIGGSFKVKNRKERLNAPLAYIMEFTRDWEIVHVQGYPGIRELFDLRYMNVDKLIDRAHNNCVF